MPKRRSAFKCNRKEVVGRKRSRASSSEEKEIDTSNSSQEIKIYGNKFVISGIIRKYSREELSNILEDLGAKVVGSVSKSTNYLIAGELLEDGRKVDEGRKYKLAVQYKIRIISGGDIEEAISKTGKYKNGALPLPTIQEASIVEDLTDCSETKKDFTPKKESNFGNVKSFFSGHEYQPASPVKPKLAERKKADREKIEEIQAEPSTENDGRSWVEKYAPKRSSELVGNNHTIALLKEWLGDWDDVVLEGNKKEIRPKRGQNWQNLPRINAKA